MPRGAKSPTEENLKARGMYFPMHPDSRQCTPIRSALAGKYEHYTSQMHRHKLHCHSFGKQLDLHSAVHLTHHCLRQPLITSSGQAHLHRINNFIGLCFFWYFFNIFCGHASGSGVQIIYLVLLTVTYFQLSFPISISV